MSNNIPIWFKKSKDIIISQLHVCIRAKLLQSCQILWAPIGLLAIARQTPLSMGFSRREYWSGLPCLPPGDLPDLGIKPLSLMSPVLAAAATAAKSHQSCPTLCDPIDSSPPGSAVPGILQARTLEWVAISFSNAWKWKVKVKSLSRARLFATPWTAAYQAPPSMGFSRQEYWSGVPLPSPLHWQAGSLPLAPHGKTINQLYFNFFKNEKKYLKIQRCLKTYSGKYLSPVTLGNHCIHVFCVSSSDTLCKFKQIPNLALSHPFPALGI